MFDPNVYRKACIYNIQASKYYGPILDTNGLVISPQSTEPFGH
jgi:hypothetical protein